MTQRGGRRSGRTLKREGTQAYIPLIPVVVWQKPTQHGKHYPPI